MDLEIKNLRFKVRYLEGKIASEEMNLGKLENQKYLVQQRVGEQIQKESEIIDRAKEYGVDFEAPEQAALQAREDQLKEELIGWQKKTDVIE